MWTQAHRERYRQVGEQVPSDLTDREWARLGALDPSGEAQWTAAHDRHVRSVERDILPAADRLPLEAPLAEPLSAALDGLQHLSSLPARRGMGKALGGRSRDRLRSPQGMLF